MATHYEFIDRQKIRKVQQKKNTFQYLPNFFWQFLALFPLSEIVNDFILFFQPQSPWKHRRLYKHEPLRPGATFPGGLVPTIRLQLDEIPEDCVTHFYLTENNGHVTKSSPAAVAWRENTGSGCEWDSDDPRQNFTEPAVKLLNDVTSPWQQADEEKACYFLLRACVMSLSNNADQKTNTAGSFLFATSATQKKQQQYEIKEFGQWCLYNLFRLKS